MIQISKRELAKLLTTTTAMTLSKYLGRNLTPNDILTIYRSFKESISKDEFLKNMSKKFRELTENIKTNEI